MAYYGKRKNPYVALKYCSSRRDLIEKENRILTMVSRLGEKFIKYNDQVYRSDSQYGQYVFEMEAGEINLHDILQIRRKYDLKNLLYIFESLSQDLDILEQNGIAWRDVKPINIILVRMENSPSLFYYKISDFGIGIVLDKGKKTCSSIDGSTDGFAAPELEKLKKSNCQYNPFRADVYSLGKLVLKMMGVKKGVNNKIPEEYEILREIIEKMLSNIPEQRPTFHEIHEYLKKKKVKKEIPIDENEFINQFKDREKAKLTFTEKIRNSVNMVETLYRLSHFKQAKQDLEKIENFWTNNQIENLNEKKQLELKYLIIAGQVYSEDKNEYAKAKDCFIKALDMNLKEKINEQDIPKIQYLIGRINHKSEDFEGALIYYKKALEPIEKDFQKKDFTKGILDPDLPNLICDLYNNMGCLIEEKSENDKAKLYYENALEVTNKQPTLITLLKRKIKILNNLGSLIGETGNYKDSEKYLEEALVRAKDYYGEKHVDTAQTYDNYGNMLFKEGKLDKAKENFIKAFNIRNEILDCNHLKIVESFCNIGKALQADLKYKEAQEKFEAALKIFDNFKEVSLEKAQICNLLGTIYIQQKNYEKTQKYLKEALEIKKKKLSENHYSIAKTLTYLGVSYFDMNENKVEKDYNICEEYYNKALEMNLKVFGCKDNMDISWNYNNLGTFYFHSTVKCDEENSKTQEIKLNIAIIYLKKTVQIRKKICGENHIETFAAERNLLDVYIKQGKYQYAEKCLQEMEQKVPKLEWCNKSEMEKIYNRFENLYKEQGLFEKALSYAKLKKKIFLENYGNNDLRTSALYQNIADYHAKLNHKEKAAKYKSKAERIKLENPGKEFSNFHYYFKDLKLRQSI